MLRRTYSLNLIAYLRSCDVVVNTVCENNKIYGVYDETNRTVLLKQQYREDEQLHRFLTEFRSLKLNNV